jgi:hypothetical protein
MLAGRNRKLERLTKKQVHAMALESRKEQSPTLLIAPSTTLKLFP